MSEDTIHQRPDTAASQRDLLPVRQTAPAGFANSLPKSFTTFVGRVDDLVKIQNLLMLDDVRLLTLTGPGGVGKTRLALEVSARMTHFADGFHVVDLASVRDPALVAITILQSLGGAAHPHRTIQEDLSAWLEHAHMLLVLDNFEHILEAAPLTGMLAASCPGVKVLVTSRTRLRISGEHVYSVPPLMVPKRDAARADAQTDAERLFVERARQTGATWTHSTTTETAIGDICRLLDGLPLAIELAAAWSPILPPAALLSRLQHRLTLLTRGPRDAPSRHRSMREAIAWSYDLLTPTDQLAFRRLAVFSGGFSLGAVRAVLPDVDVIDVIYSLVAKSLVVPVEGRGDEPRFMMLETLREYGQERLVDADDEAGARCRHAAYYMSLAEWSDWCWFMSLEDGEARLAQLNADEANIRASLEWFRHQGDRFSILRMATMLGGLWIVLGRPHEGQRWLEAALQDTDDVPETVLARALATFSWTLNVQGDASRAFALAEEAVAISRSHDDVLNTAKCLLLSGVPAYRLDKFDHAKSRFEEAMAILAHCHDPYWVQGMIVTLSSQLGLVALMQGNIAEAEAWYRSALDLELAQGEAPGHSHIFGHVVPAGLGDIARAKGDSASALHLYQQCLTLGRRYHNVRAVTYALGGIAGALAALGSHNDAARLFGACEALHITFGFRFDADTLNRQRALGLPEPWMRANESITGYEGLRDALHGQHSLLPVADPDGTARIWADGRRMTLSTAVSEALAVVIEPVETYAEPTVPSSLTKRELEVLQLLVSGASDVAIAETLYISRRTVATHVRHIYDKLGISSRAEAAAQAVRLGLA